MHFGKGVLDTESELQDGSQYSHDLSYFAPHDGHMDGVLGADQADAMSDDASSAGSDITYATTSSSTGPNGVPREQKRLIRSESHNYSV